MTKDEYLLTKLLLRDCIILGEVEREEFLEDCDNPDDCKSVITKMNTRINGLKWKLEQYEAVKL